MVRLIEKFPLAANLIVIEFQFHYGAINSVYLFNFLFRFGSFQFHYGAINSNCHRLVLFQKCEFQFHYGAINRSNYRNLFERLFAFQFHYGVINSLLVLPFVFYIKYFNSTMVRLIDYTGTPNQLNGCYFNSTMVRLIVPIRAKGITLRIFQFHYGAINRS